MTDRIPKPLSEEPSADVRRLRSTVEWYGFLTLDNIHAIAERIRGLIGDRQRYTWVACNEGLGNYRPEVRTGQVAEQVRVTADDGHGLITVVDSYGVWGLHTDVADQAAGRGQTPDFSAPYLKITRSQVQIEHRAPVGARLYWVVAAEDGGDRD